MFIGGKLEVEEEEGEDEEEGEEEEEEEEEDDDDEEEELESLGTSLCIAKSSLAFDGVSASLLCPYCRQ